MLDGGLMTALPLRHLCHLCAPPLGFGAARIHIPYYSTVYYATLREASKVLTDVHVSSVCSSYDVHVCPMSLALLTLLISVNQMI